MPIALVYQRGNVFSYRLLDGVDRPMGDLSSTQSAQCAMMVCGRTRNYIGVPYAAMNTVFELGPGLASMRTSLGHRKAYSATRYVEYEGDIWGVSSQSSDITLFKKGYSSTVHVEPRWHVSQRITSGEDGKLYFGDILSGDLPIGRVHGWYMINMVPPDCYADNNPFADCPLRFCAGDANNLYCSTALRPKSSGSAIKLALTMRDPRCESATYTGHSGVISISNVDGVIICEQNDMINIYDERANAMVGTGICADNYIGAVRYIAPPKAPVPQQ